MTIPKPRADKFWRHVVKGHACWSWTGDLSRKGYGQIREQVKGKRKWLRAHRVSWELHYGPIPKGADVLHRCDNPPCSRPDHLFLGTIQLNAEDAVRKGRIKLPGAKLTSEQRQWALAQKGKLPRKEIAKQLGVISQTIKRLFEHKTWNCPLQVYAKLP